MSEELQKVVEDLRELTEKSGFYLRAHRIGAASTIEDDDTDIAKEMPESDELRRKLINGDISVILFTHFTLNEVAFSDRIQKPNKVKMEDEFNMVVPSENDEFMEQMKRNIAAGRNPFDDGD